MSDRRAIMIADRRMRDTARAMVDADFTHLKNNLSRKGIAARAVDRVTEGAQDVYEQAVEVASDNRGALAAILAALLLWFARNPIMDALFGQESDRDEDEDEVSEHRRSRAR